MLPNAKGIFKLGGKFFIWKNILCVTLCIMVSEGALNLFWFCMMLSFSIE